MTTYTSTRGGSHGRSFEDVLLRGLAEDGGLFVPETWPAVDLQALAGLSYPETVARLLAPFTTGCFDAAELEAMARDAYAAFRHPATAPLVQLDHDEWLLELFHGPTFAFKDFAMQLLGRMFEAVLKRRGESITIVGATSGDTGAAAVRAFAGLERIRVAILFPEGRISPVQQRQMTTASAANVEIIAVQGTFDDCQNRLKDMFNDQAFRGDLKLAAVNSINWARVVAQAGYYVYSALRLGGLARPLAFAVPTGNFGDVYAGYVASRIGLPVARLIVATNTNDILARFLSSGRYARGEVAATMSPSMDIQVASNFERLLFELLDRDGAAVAQLMADFARDGALELDENRLAAARRLFAGARVDEATTAATIAEVRAATGQLVDPHTAVGIRAGRDLCPPGTPLVTLATAHPAKFPEAMTRATGEAAPLPEPLAAMLQAHERFTTLPNDLAALQAHLRAWAGPTA
ncbi:MAG: threonine synthase [Geminicoccaceae bacterium]|nr:threonine synthase [Geminicoccaceae bacterium]